MHTTQDTSATLAQTPLPETAAPLLVSVAEAARLMSISPTSAWKLIRAGEWDVRRIAGRTLVPRAELERIAGHRGGKTRDHHHG